MSYRYSITTEWGDLCGLKAEDLTTNQLEKIESRKLVEFVREDHRAQKILGDRIENSTNLEDAKSVLKLDDSAIEHVPYLKSKYNIFIGHMLDKIEKPRYGYYRRDFIKWKWLSDGNKHQEMINWIDEKDSVFQIPFIDIKDIYANHKWLMDTVIDKTIRSDHFPHILKDLPKEYMLKYLDAIKIRWPYHILSNPHISEDEAIKQMKDLAGKKRVGKIWPIIKKDRLNKLPPVMRLKLLESVLIYNRGSVNFPDIKTVEEFSELLFGTSMRYTQRVQKVTEIFRRLYAQEKKDEEFSELLFGTSMRYTQRVQKVTEIFRRLYAQEKKDE